MSIFRSKVKNVLVDLSGTIHIENERIPGATEALNRLRKAGVNIRFVTNTTKESRRVLQERLLKLGFDIHSDEIFSSLTAAKNLIDKEKLKPLMIIDDCAMEDFEGVDSFHGQPDSVVVALAPEKFNYETMNKAFRVLLRGGRLIAVHEGRYYRIGSGDLSLGPGAFVRGLSYAADVKPTVVGKPSKDFFLAALKGQEPSSAVMIGDDIRDDVQGATAAGIAGILVKTGKYRAGDEQLIDPTTQTSLPTFSEAVNLVLQHV